MYCRLWKISRVVATSLLLAGVPSFVASQSHRQSVEIDWATAEKDLTKTLETPQLKTRGGVADTNSLSSIRVPVLALDKGQVRASPRIRGLGSSYVAAYTIDGAVISVTGTASAAPAPADSAVSASIKRGQENVVFETTEDGADLTFQRYAAGYVIRISCKSADDKRCKNDVFLKKMQQSLILVGGKK
jgi:hypothetical protein